MRVDISHPTDRPNFSIVRVGDLSLAFSYQTVIGFARRGSWILSENLWSNTTGKHLNYLGGKTGRLSRDLFEQALQIEFDILDRP